MPICGCRVRLVPDGHHAEGVAAEGLRDRRVRGLQREPHRVLVQLLHARDVHGGRGGVPGEAVALGPDALERVDDVVGRHRLAVLELDALAQLDGVLLRVVLGDALGQAVGGELVVLVEEQQRLEGGHQPGLVGLGDDVLAVHDVLGAAAGDPEPEVPAPLGRPGRGRGRRARADEEEPEPHAAARPPTAASPAAPARSCRRETSVMSWPFCSPALVPPEPVWVPADEIPGDVLVAAERRHGSAGGHEPAAHGRCQRRRCGSHGET